MDNIHIFKYKDDIYKGLIWNAMLRFLSPFWFFVLVFSLPFLAFETAPYSASNCLVVLRRDIHAPKHKYSSHKIGQLTT